jgi:hypothetical protein
MQMKYNKGEIIAVLYLFSTFKYFKSNSTGDVKIIPYFNISLWGGGKLSVKNWTYNPKISRHSGPFSQ